MAAQPTSGPRPTWPEQEEKVKEERQAYQNSIDFLELKRKSPIDFMKAFIIIRPIRIEFEGMTVKYGVNFGIVGINSTGTIINYFAPKYKGGEILSTYDIDQYLRHVYITMTDSLPNKAEYHRIYEKFKSEPKKAILCNFTYMGKKKQIRLSDLIDDQLLEALAKHPQEKIKKEIQDEVFQKRQEFQEALQRREEKKGSKRKTSDDDSDDDVDATVPVQKVHEEPVSKKKKESTPIKPKPVLKKKKEESLSVNIEDANPDWNDTMSEVVLKGLSTIFDYPLEDGPIMFKVIFDTAALLRERAKSQKKN